MPPQAAKPLPLILAELRAHAARGATGVQSIATDDGRFASIRLRDGQVESVTFRAKHNDEAIRLLAEVGGGRTSFLDMALRTSPSPHIAPISAAMRDWLLGKGDAAGASSSLARATPAPGAASIAAATAKPTPAPRAPPQAPAARPAEPVAGERARSRRWVIEQVAARYLGPIATLVCEDVLADTSDAEQALERIAAHLVSLEEVQRFLNEARAALRGASDAD